MRLAVERLSVSLSLSGSRGLGMFMVTGGFEFETEDATSYS
jgi:hypothetical protein